MAYVRVRSHVTLVMMTVMVVLMGAATKARAFSSHTGTRRSSNALRRNQGGPRSLFLNAEISKADDSSSILGRSSSSDKPTYGEESRQYRRTVYAHEDWIKHRRSD